MGIKKAQEPSFFKGLSVTFSTLEKSGARTLGVGVGMVDFGGENTRVTASSSSLVGPSVYFFRLPPHDRTSEKQRKAARGDYDQEHC
jgi:hypothetical protein